MTRSLFALGGTLLLGAMLGVWLHHWKFSGTAQAEPLARVAAEQIYAELESTHGSLQDGSRQLSKIAAVTTPSVVHIESRRQSAQGTLEETGSGVIVTSPKAAGLYIVTNRHVIFGATPEDIKIQLHDGRDIRPAQIWKDAETDLAVLKINVTGVQPGRWADSDTVEIGHMVLALGSPFGLSRSVTYGIISAKGRRSLELGKESEVLNQNFLQTDAAINPGNSGGPLIDLHGRVVGINTAIASSSGGNDGIGFSIPSNLARRVVDELLEHGKVRRGYLGVKLDPKFDLTTAQQLGLTQVQGSRVLSVHENTPAARAQLQFNDVILQFDGKDVEDETHLINIVSLSPVGQRVEMVVLRNRRQVRMYIVLADRSELERQSRLDHPSRQVRLATLQGVSMTKLPRGVNRQLGLPVERQGLLVMDLDPRSSLGESLRLYDVIEEVARTPVSSLDDLQRVIEQSPAGEPLLLKVRRVSEGHEKSLLILWERPAAE